MKPPEHGSAHRRTAAEERRIREASLDETIEASFPASDPPSTLPNPGAHDALDEVPSPALAPSAVDDLERLNRGPAPVVMREFGRTPHHVVETAKTLLKTKRGG